MLFSHSCALKLSIEREKNVSEGIATEYWETKDKLMANVSRKCFPLTSRKLNQAKTVLTKHVRILEMSGNKNYYFLVSSRIKLSKCQYFPCILCSRWFHDSSS